jgi:hypothetical protein
MRINNEICEKYVPGVEFISGNVYLRWRTSRWLLIIVVFIFETPEEESLGFAPNSNDFHDIPTSFRRRTKRTGSDLP